MRDAIDVEGALVLDVEAALELSHFLLLQRQDVDLAQGIVMNDFKILGRNQRRPWVERHMHVC